MLNQECIYCISIAFDELPNILNHVLKKNVFYALLYNRPNSHPRF